jgi:hypothetical protein
LFEHMRNLLRPLALVTVAAAALTAAPASAVHESHHGPFIGETSQDGRFVMNTPTHRTLGIRFRWRATCESGSVTRITRLRNVPVSEEGRFFKRSRLGVGVRGKIGFDPQGNPVFPEPFSFANNEARGRLRANVNLPDRGRCTSGLVTWDAHR